MIVIMGLSKTGLIDPVIGDKKLGWQNIDGKWYYLTKRRGTYG